MRAKDCMTENAIWAKPGTNMCDVAKLMGDNQIGCVPVCEDTGKIVGIVTDRDLILRGVACDKDTKTTPISDIMTKEVIRTSPDTDITEVAEIMAKNQIRRIPVVIDEKVVGIVSLANLAYSNDLTNENLGGTLDCICHSKGKHEA